MTESAELGNSNVVRANKLQSNLIDNWNNMLDRCGDIDVCICNGDLCDGDNYRNNGEGLWTADADIQSDVAAELLSAVDADIYHGINGTGYHTGKYENRDKMTMKKLGGTFDDEVILNYGGARIHCRHETGFTTVPHTRSTKLNLDMVNTSLEWEEYGDINIFLRGHTHYAHALLWKNKLGIITPCWKYKDSFAKKRQNISSDIGYTLLDIEDGEYSFKLRTFELPPIISRSIPERGEI